MSKDTNRYWKNKLGLTEVEKQVEKEEKSGSRKSPKGIVYGKPKFEVQSYNVVVDHYNYMTEAVEAAKKIGSSIVRVFKYNPNGTKVIVWSRN